MLYLANSIEFVFLLQNSLLISNSPRGEICNSAAVGFYLVNLAAYDFILNLAAHDCERNNRVRWRIQSTMNLFDFSFCVIGDVLASEEPIYNVFPKLTQIIEEKGKNLGSDYTEVQPKVWVHKTANVSDRAILCAPIIVCAGAEIRPNAFLRGSVIVGEKAVVGAACEVKNSILFSGAQVPHLSYVGDSILGAGAHFGAGVIASNLRLDQRNVFVAFDGERTDSGLRKLGALVGDGAQIGCNSVLCPGAVVEKYAIVKPLSCVVGTAFCNKEGDRT